MKQVHITTGDHDGIGLEIVLKSLIEIPVEENIQYVLWRTSSISSSFQPLFQKIDQKWKRKVYKQFNDSVSEKDSLIDIASENDPVYWVETVTRLCLENPQSKAMATAPLSKLTIKNLNKPYKGHTDILKKISKCFFAYMCFLGEKFNVVLLTDHIPLKEVKLSESLVEKCIDILLKKRMILSGGKKAIGLLGFNPHAGEKGILGKEEIEIFQPVVRKFQIKHPQCLEGPLVPDRAFDSKNWNQYSFYLCAYHDQGLIPFKMIHKNQGVHTTLGLPFIRTSVDHGTAKDIFCQNKASYISMKKAIMKASQWLYCDEWFY